MIDADYEPDDSRGHLVISTVPDGAVLTPVPGESGGVIDISKPHSARMYDFYLDGKDNYPVDREAAREVEKWFPTVKLCAKTNRAFMRRATKYLAQNRIDQFVDIGTGIPTEPNLHQIAQEVLPRARVVYVDYDRLVLSYARAMMAGTPEARTEYLEADVRDPEAIVSVIRAGATVDLSRPVALSLIALLHFIPDSDWPYSIVGTLLEALAPGSFLVMSHVTGDHNPEQIAKVAEVYRNRGLELRPRSSDEFAEFFTGLELVDPGITGPHHWHPDSEPSAEMDAQVSFYSAVAQKP